MEKKDFFSIREKKEKMIRKEETLPLPPFFLCYYYLPLAHLLAPWVGAPAQKMPLTLYCRTLRNVYGCLVAITIILPSKATSLFFYFFIFFKKIFFLWENIMYLSMLFFVLIKPPGLTCLSFPPIQSRIPTLLLLFLLLLLLLVVAAIIVALRRSIKESFRPTPLPSINNEEGRGAR